MEPIAVSAICAAAQVVISAVIAIATAKREIKKFEEEVEQCR